MEGLSCLNMKFEKNGHCRNKPMRTWQLNHSVIHFSESNLGTPAVPGLSRQRQPGRWGYAELVA